MKAALSVEVEAVIHTQGHRRLLANILWERGSKLNIRKIRIRRPALLHSKEGVVYECKKCGKRWGILKKT